MSRNLGVLPWPSYAKTHRGNVRKVNEDSLLCAPELGLWGVADGMGGHEAGDVASQMVVECLAQLNWREGQAITEKIDLIEDRLLAANDRMCALSKQHHQGKTMGTTVVLLLVEGSVGCCLWAGDSRLYRIRDGALQQVSEDHSQVAELLLRGQITEQQAINHPNRNVITRAIGASERLSLDVMVFEVLPKDTFLLCSDGLSNELSAEQILTHLKQDSLQLSVEQMVARCLDGGARDNLSVVVVQAPGEHADGLAG